MVVTQGDGLKRAAIHFSWKSSQIKSEIDGKPLIGLCGNRSGTREDSEP